jgi:hypothetical protein
VPCVFNTVFARCKRNRNNCYSFAHGVASKLIGQPIKMFGPVG